MLKKDLKKNVFTFCAFHILRISFPGGQCECESSRLGPSAVISGFITQIPVAGDQWLRVKEHACMCAVTFRRNAYYVF